MKRMIAIVMIVMMLMSAWGLAETVNGESSDTRIRSVQQSLVKIQLLEATGVTGVWDEGTIKATLRFQRFVNKVQGEGTVVESGECDDATLGYLEYADSKAWNVGEQVGVDEVKTPNELAAEARSAEEAQAAAEEAARVQAENDSATIAYVQSMLRQLGLLEEVNGVYDNATKDAIVRAQMYINEKQGAGTVEVNGAYNDPETMAWLNRGTEENWEIASTGTVPEVSDTNETETAGTEPTEEGTASAENAPIEPIKASRIGNFRLTIDGEEKSGTVALTPGQHSIAWSGDNVAMFSMYMYNSDGTLINKNENMGVTYFTLDTFGMTAGAVYEIRIGAVPNGGQVADMEWKSLFVTLG